MINGLNLVWIIPLCCVVSFIAASFMLGATCQNREEHAYRHGFKEGFKQGQEMRRFKGLDKND